MSNEKTGRRGKKRIWGKDDTELSLLALPTTIWYLLFCFLPMFGIIIAFKNYKVYGGFLTSFIKSEWVGFNNFKFLFSSKDIWLILRNTLGYNVIFIILGIVAPVAAAIAVGQLHSNAERDSQPQGSEGLSDHHVLPLLPVLGRCKRTGLGIFVL